MSTGEHPEVQAAKITARATRQIGRLAAVTALLGACIGGVCMVANTTVTVALPVLLQDEPESARLTTYLTVENIDSNGKASITIEHFDSDDHTRVATGHITVQWSERFAESPEILLEIAERSTRN